MAEGSVAQILLAGKVLSALALLVVLAAVVNVWRRRSFPGLAYGGIVLASRRIRWIWFLVLTGALGFGVNEDPILVSTRSMNDPEAADSAAVLKRVNLSVPLPFYSYRRERTFGDGVLVAEDVTEGFLVPWPLVSALFAYLVLVLVWNPNNPWARRILQGRRWRSDADPEVGRSLGEGGAG